MPDDGKRTLTDDEILTAGARSRAMAGDADTDDQDTDSDDTDSDAATDDPS
jgi:hypothetical protein